ncbi:MAG: hypothetical protein HRU75_11865 [Planctomycetia bacterium]|nr:MAG: hypothetical protein HRU75_11865 [Planctomycetia bacterium]
MTAALAVPAAADDAPAPVIDKEALAAAEASAVQERMVSFAPGQPDWTQRDVDALRKAIGDYTALRDQAIKAGTHTSEYDFAVGNFVGQAMVRGIAFQDILPLYGDVLSDPGVAAEVLDYLHYQENYSYSRAGIESRDYRPIDYSDEVVGYIEAHGRTLRDIRTIVLFDDGGGEVLEGGIAGVEEGQCYIKTTFAKGMTLLAGATVLWSADGTDDAAADIPLGFELAPAVPNPFFHFVTCDSGAGLSQLRVSTNGYATFFELGGTAELGTAFFNVAVPNGSAPNAMIAPWWDDLVMQVAQGLPDTVSYKTEGSAPNRVLTVQYHSVSRLGGTTTDWHNFQMKFFEHDLAIEFHYSNDWNADTSDSATIGMESRSPFHYNCGPNCGDANGAAPGANYRFRQPKYNEDNCASAAVMCPRYSVAAFRVLALATNDGASTCGLSSNSRDLWFKFTAPCNGTVTFESCFLGGGVGATDPVFSIHSACPGTAGNTLACNNDVPGDPDCDVWHSRVSAFVAGGQTVYCRVAHFWGSIGTDSTDIRCLFQTANPPPNDDCQDAQLASSGSVFFGNVTCSNQTPFHSMCGGSGGDVWYRFLAPSCPGVLHVSMCGTEQLSGIHSTLGAYSSCPNSDFTDPLVCVTDTWPQPNLCGGGPETDAQIALPLTAGQHVYIRVGFGGICEGYTDGQYRVQFNYVANANPVSNDICQGALPAPCNSARFGSNCGATVDAAAPQCAPLLSNGAGVWYYTFGNGEIYTATTCGLTNFDTQLSVYTGNCGALTCVVANDDNQGCDLNPFSSRVTWQTVPGQMYFIMVHGFSSAKGEFELRVESTAPPHDQCADAIPLNLPAVVSANLACATNEGHDTPCALLSEEKDVWYSITVPCDGLLVVDGCGSYGAGQGQVDLAVAVHATCDGPELACNDDAFNPACGFGLDPYLARPVSAGEQLLIRILNLGNLSGGPFSVSIAIQPLNDECAQAASIADGATPFCTDGANTDGPLTCLIRSDVWYRYRASCTGTLTIDTCGSAFNTALAVYNGWGCPAGAEAHCSDDVCGDDASVSFPVTIGELLLIRVGGPLGSGQGVINISCSTDVCGGVQRADSNCDGLINNFDIDPFVAGILDPQNPVAPAAYAASVPNAQECWDKRACWGDANCDAVFNNFDIDPFVNCLLFPLDCTPCP